MKKSHGNLVDIGLPKLLHLIYKQNNSFGILDILREPIKKRFFFVDGVPVFATSNILGEVLGRLLMLEGIITQKDYEKSLEAVLKENRRHGEVLTSMGLITAAELDNFLHLQLKRRAWKIFGWNEGTYNYEVVDALPAGATPMPLHPAKLILDGISLGFYPLERIREELSGYLDTVMVPAFDSTRYKAEDFGLNIQEARFFEKFDGSASVQDVLDGSFLLKQRALSLTLSLIMTGSLAPLAVEGGVAVKEETLNLVEEEERKESAAPATGSRLNAELLFMRAKSAFAESNFDVAVDTLKQIIEINPMEGEYWAWLGWALYNSDPSKIKEAESTIKDAIDLNNELDGAWYFLARIFFDNGEYKAAESAYMTSCDKNPWMLEAVAELKRIEIRRSIGIETGDMPHPEYVDAFGFAFDPFSTEPHDRYKVPSAGATETLETILSAIQKREGPIIVEAKEGAGKTTLIIELLRSLSNKKTLAAAILSPAKRELQLIKTINAELHATTESRSIKEQLLSLGMKISQNNSQGGSTIILLDKAHELTTGCLKLVQYLARLKSLQLILISEPGLSLRLKEPDFAELNRKSLVRLDIAPLTLAETGGFFRKRISATPATKTRPTLDDTALSLLFKECGGTPSAAVRCSALLLNAAATSGVTAIDETVASAAFFGTRGTVATEITEPDTLTLESIAPEPAPAPEQAPTAASVVPDDAGELELIELEPLEPLGVVGTEETPEPLELTDAAEPEEEEDFLLEAIIDEEIGEPLDETEIEALGEEPETNQELIVELDEQSKEAPNLDLLEEVIAPAEKSKGKADSVKEKKAKSTKAAPETASEAVEVETEPKGKKRKGGLSRLVLIAILMILLGLLAGSYVSQYLLGP
ncbi:MAG: tetratricopeptide repeat protein [Proteobacteria bacterium]|nr:tetratricopeptide repeat protein [Pseudomonadota bacterium]